MKKAKKDSQNSLKPQFFSSMKGYTKAQLAKDLVAGVIVAIIALPLSIALALASGVRPEQGLYTAITAGFVVSFLGGSRVQIAGPTAAFATIVAGIVATQGMDGLVISTILAGIFLVIMGICKFGSLIKYIPSTITTGFTFGIAVTIAIGQVKDFCGMRFENSPIETTEKVIEICHSFDTFNYQSFLVGLLSLAILIFVPMIPLKVFKKVPPSLIAVIVCAALVKLANLNVDTIGDLYTISSALPTFSVPEISFERIKALIPDAFTIAILAAVESLLSCVVADGMIGSKHRSNVELTAQGAGNIVSALFGGIPATGAIARTAANVKNGGRTPVAGMVHAVVLLVILVLLMPYASMIPMPTIAAILFVVAYNMSGWREIINTLKTAPKSDSMVLVTTLVLTVVFDLVVAIGVGMVLAALLFMKRMADVTETRSWVDDEDELDEADDPDHISLKKIPDNTQVFEINGPMFFAAFDKFNYFIEKGSKLHVLCIRMRNVPAIDASGVAVLSRLVEYCGRKNIEVVFAHVNPQPLKAMRKAGIVKKVGAQNICPHIDEALARAEEIERLPLKRVKS